MRYKESKDFDFIRGEILVLNKPLDWTSFDLVNKVRIMLCRLMKIKKLKLGHAGTLDPKATGVMVLCSGKLTKQIDEIQADEKEYIALLKVGATTPSFDLETEEDEQFSTDHITRETVENILPSFAGTIEQVPPAYSAIKVDGKRAYKLARKGKEVELKPKMLVVKEIELLRFEMPEIELRIVCSKGTYIRALARDIGKALNSGAYLKGLVRTRIGEYSIEQCLDLTELADMLSAHFNTSKNTII
ncbi:MAG: tRNA pseudouridine(55) synthase TruB [Prolixibacteraceae bacterium]|jgi:tRNA pseudouridine55 synthase|nr:tRNA pseudouridine(55) synthase TruB [Prolixibacteraceae bacterium]